MDDKLGIDLNQQDKEAGVQAQSREPNQASNQTSNQAHHDVALASRKGLEAWRSQLRSALEQNDLETAKRLLTPAQPADVAAVLRDVPKPLQALAFRLLPKAESIAIYEYLDKSVQQSLIEELKGPDVLEVVEQMSPDDRVRLFDELPAPVVNRLLSALSPEERLATALLLGYEIGTAGHIMTPEYIALQEDWTVSQALEQIRRLANDSETIYYLYVTDPVHYLTGVLSLRGLVVAQPEQTIAEIMVRQVIYSQTDTRQEEVAKLIQRYDFLALPVVDLERRLVGIVTVDDVLDVLEQETTRDIYALGGLQSGGDGYFQTSLFTIARRRVLWLLVLLITNTGTSAVIRSQQDILQQVVALAAFIPLLIGTGGNVGAQSSTVVIRGLNTEEVANLSAARIIGREALAGLLLGAMLGAVVLIWAYFLQGSWAVATAVGISLVAISVLASIAGSALPLVFQSLKLDPALMSAPFITTAVDVLGVLIYLTVASLILNLR